MILKRLGNKKKIADTIIQHFPPHEVWIEPFFGAGGMFFNKPKAKFNFVNDLDSDVFNLFKVVMEDKEALIDLFSKMPIHSDLLEYWKHNKEEDPVKKAVRFLMLSNLTWLGKGGSLDMGTKNKNQTLPYIDKTFEFLSDVKFTNFTFSKFIKSVQLIKSDTEKCFIYCDPPYLGTDDNYSDSFTEELSKELFDVLEESKCKWAMSEFDHPFILEQAKKRGLNVIIIGERTNLKNKRTEVLITNYENSQLKLF